MQEPRDGGDCRHINLAGLTGPGSEWLLIHAADSFLMCNKLILHHSPATRCHSLVDEGVNVSFHFVLSALQRPGSLKLALSQPCVGDDTTHAYRHIISVYISPLLPILALCSVHALTGSAWRLLAVFWLNCPREGQLSPGLRTDLL